MQQSVTKHKSNKCFNLRNYLGLVLIIVFIFVVIIGIIIAGSIKSKSYEFISGKTFYYYYTNIESSLNRAKSLADSQKSAGGAGFVFEENKKFYVCAFLYDKMEDAKIVIDQNKEAYPDGGVITKNTQKLTNKAQKLIKNDEYLISAVHLYGDCFNAFYDLAIECDKNNLSEAEVFSKVFVYYEKIVDVCGKFDNINSPVSINLDSLLTSVKEYLSQTKTSTERSYKLKQLCFEIIDKYNQLAGYLNLC